MDTIDKHCVTIELNEKGVQPKEDDLLANDKKTQAC